MIGVIWHMNTAFKKLWPKKNGIYKITNRITGRFYIGKAGGKKGFWGRWCDHRRRLRNGTHYCCYLQHSYDKHGEDCFTFEILELKDYGVPLGDLESEYIVNLKAMYYEDGYNMTNKKFVAKYPKEDRKNHPQSKEFELLDPEGNLVKGKNLSQFCEEVGISADCMFDVISGRSKSHKGYKSANPEFHRIVPEHRLLSAEKELFIFSDTIEFARKIGVTPNSVGCVLRGKTASVKGYHLENPSPRNQKTLDRLFNKKLLINKNMGIIVRFTALTAFSLKYTVSHGSLRNFFEGKGNLLARDYNWDKPTDEEMKLYPIIEEDF